MKKHVYTEEDDKFIKENYGIIGGRKTAEILNKPYHNLLWRASRLKVSGNLFKMTPEKFEYVKKSITNYEKNMRELSIELGINYSSLREYCQNNGFDFKKYSTKEMRYKNGGSKDKGFGVLYYRYETNSKKRNLIFSLTKEQFKELIFKNCFYCNKAPSNDMGHKFESIKYNGIDRMNNQEGYTLSNSVTCCEICNFMKGSLGLDEFYKHIESIFNTRIRDKKW